MAWPTTVDVFPNIGVTTNQNDAGFEHDLLHNQETAAIVTLETATIMLPPFTFPGVLTVQTGKPRLYLPFACTLVQVRASVNTQPTGASIICDVNKNGTTVFTTQSNRPTIAVSTNTVLSGTINVTALAVADYVQVDIDQIGSTIAGSDLTVQLLVTRP